MRRLRRGKWKGGILLHLENQNVPILFATTFAHRSLKLILLPIETGLARMAGRKRDTLRKQDLIGLKYFPKLRPCLGGCMRTAVHGIRPASAGCITISTAY